MYDVKFLGLEFTLNPVAFTLPFGNGWSVYWYGILIAVGFFMAFLYGLNRAPKLGINKDRLLDGVLITTPLAIVGARVYYVAFDPEVTIKEILDIHDGGIAIYGAIIGAVIGIVISCYTRGINFLDCIDLVAPCFFIGQAIGRWGNFFNQEAFGVNTNLPWGMYSEQGTFKKILADQLFYEKNMNLDPELPVHPCFLYESLLCIVGFVILHLVMKRRSFRGQLVLLYGIIYGSGRFFIEGIRTDSLMIGSLRVSQLLSAVIVIACVVVYILCLRKSKEKRERESDYKPLFNNDITEDLTLTLKDVLEEGSSATETEGWES